MIEHRFADALAAAEQAAAALPDVAKRLNLTVDALTELGRYDEAIARADALAAHAPGIPAWLRVAHLRYLFGDTDGAIELTARAARAGAPRGEPSAWVWLDLMRLLLDTRRLPEAEAAYAAAAAAMPDLPALRSARARLALAAGRDREALQGFRAAVAAQPNAEDALAGWRIARSLHDSGAEKHLAAMLGALEKLDRVRSRRTLAEFHLEAGRVDRALQLAREEYQARPDIYTAAVYAQTLAAYGDDEAARRLAGEALASGCQDPVLDLVRALLPPGAGQAAP